MHHLPLTVDRSYSPVHYARYLATPPSEKSRWLLTLAKHDSLYAPIIRALETYGYRVQHRFFGQNGAYYPSTVRVEEECAINEAIRAQHAQGTLHASFCFSSRYGAAQIAHYWLHELMHFWQDLHGLFLTPLLQKDVLPIMLDAPSHIAVTCLCEAMAETEALRASWRLKEIGYPVAWQGASASLDWRRHARAYARDLSAMPEPLAARQAFDRWHRSRQRPYYEKRALRAYRSTINELNIEDTAAMNAQLRRVDLDRLIRRFPASHQPDYLTMSDSQSLNDPCYSTIRHARTARQVRALENRLGTCTNSDFEDIRIGSAAHLWHVSHMSDQIAENGATERT